jgi:hypothetical protein
MKVTCHQVLKKASFLRLFYLGEIVSAAAFYYDEQFCA